MEWFGNRYLRSCCPCLFRRVACFRDARISHLSKISRISSLSPLKDGINEVISKVWAVAYLFRLVKGLYLSHCIDDTYSHLFARDNLLPGQQFYTRLYYLATSPGCAAMHSWLGSVALSRLQQTSIGNPSKFVCSFSFLYVNFRSALTDYHHTGKQVSIILQLLCLAGAWNLDILSHGFSSLMLLFRRP